ncbi:hypothetical protein Taro_020125 [Colocasia esculenta]|uniref:Uncharacterized protein n=1 Tax=Colocasia esculenta TaxID=4460 RepID=A0A843V7K6_COLES|nr:hypothetical protein [Colocasia esculenta]
MSSRSRSWVWRLRTVNDMPSHSSEDSIAGHPSQALFLITQRASFAASASSSVAKTPSWGRGTGRRSPSRGATERRLELGHKWNVRVIGGYGDIAERNRQNHTHQNMTYRQGRTSIYRLKDDFTHQHEPDRMEVFRMRICKDLPDGTQQWVDDGSNDRFERMTHMTTPSLQSDDVTPISAEDAFIAVMGRDRLGRVRCAGNAETLRTWYGRGEGSSSSDGYHTQVQQLQDQNIKMEEMCAERKRSRDHQKLENMRSQMLEMRALMQQLAAQPSHMPRPTPEIEPEGSDEFAAADDDDD